MTTNKNGQPKLVSLVFCGAWGSYRQGDLAGFHPDKAADLIKAGVAETPDARQSRLKAEEVAAKKAAADQAKALKAAAQKAAEGSKDEG